MSESDSPGMPLRHSEELITESPDDWTLARLFLPREHRDAATGLLALRHELKRVPTSSEEPGIVHMKLQWWRDEIDRAFDGKAQHPVLQLLAVNADAALLESDYLQELVDAAEMEFDAGAIRNEAERKLYLYRSSGVLAELFSRMAVGIDRDHAKTARAIGLARGQLDVMQGLAIDLARNCLRIPLDSLARHDIAPAMLAQVSQEKRHALLKDERDVLDTLRIEARTLIAGCEPTPALRVIWKRLEEDYRRLPRNLDSLTVTAPATPGMLRRLMSSWRAARRPINH